MKGRVYKNRYIEALESLFLLNLGILSVATIYVREIDIGNTSQALLSGLSIGVAFVTFLGILLFHVFRQLKKIKIWKEGTYFKANERLFIESSNDGNDPQKHDHEFTCSATQLQESLLDSKSDNVNNYGTNN